MVLARQEDATEADSGARDLDEAHRSGAVYETLQQPSEDPAGSGTAATTTAQHVEALCASPQFQRLAEERQYGPAGTQVQRSNIEAITAHLQLCKVAAQYSVACGRNARPAGSPDSRVCRQQSPPPRL